MLRVDAPRLEGRIVSFLSISPLSKVAQLGCPEGSFCVGFSHVKKSVW